MYIAVEPRDGSELVTCAVLHVTLLLGGPEQLSG